jgi:hypothetical protein
MEVTDNTSGQKREKGGEMTNVKYTQLICPIPQCSKILTVEKSKGYSNPFDHLIYCYSGLEGLKMAPAMFEALLILKINKKFWGLEDVIIADGKCKNMAD